MTKKKPIIKKTENRNPPLFGKIPVKTNLELQNKSTNVYKLKFVKKSFKKKNLHEKLLNVFLNQRY